MDEDWEIEFKLHIQLILFYFCMYALQQQQANEINVKFQ